MKNKIKDYVAELETTRQHYRELAAFCDGRNDKEMANYYRGRAFATDDTIKDLNVILGVVK